MLSHRTAGCSTVDCPVRGYLERGKTKQRCQLAITVGMDGSSPDFWPAVVVVAVKNRPYLCY